MADDAEYLLQVQVSEMQQIGERLRSKLRTLWTNGTPSFAETFAEVWPQLPAGLRAEMVKSGTTCVEDTLPPPRGKHETLLHITCPEIYQARFHESDTDMKRLIDAVVAGKENDRSYFLYDECAESLRVFLERMNYEVYDPFKGHRNNRAMTSKLCLENRKLWMVKFVSNVVAEMCQIVSQLEQQQRQQREAAAGVGSASSTSTSTMDSSSSSSSSSSGGASRDVCARCGKEGAPSRCSRCKTFKYCNRECQVAHWPAHKSSCSK